MTKNSKKILIVDDDARICRMLERYLARQDFVVQSSLDGAQINEALSTFSPDLIILDLNFPGEHGFEIAKNIRKQNSEVGLIFLTGNTDSIDKIVGLELGADDYIAKPFEERELLARIRSVLRRSVENQTSEKSQSIGILNVGQIHINLDAFEITLENGEKVDLTTREFQLVAYLAKNRHKVISRDQILDNLFGRDWSPMDRSVDVLIGKIRKKFAKHELSEVIVSVRNAGYKLVEPRS